MQRTFNICYCSWTLLHCTICTNICHLWTHWPCLLLPHLHHSGILQTVTSTDSCGSPLITAIQSQKHPSPSVSDLVSNLPICTGSHRPKPFGPVSLGRPCQRSDWCPCKLALSNFAPCLKHSVMLVRQNHPLTKSSWLSLISPRLSKWSLILSLRIKLPNSNVQQSSTIHRSFLKLDLTLSHDRANGQSSVKVLKW